MKKYIVLIATLFVSTYSMEQAKKPTIMIVPSDNWCIQKGFIDEVDNQGTKIKVPNYKRALQESSDLLNIISKINGLMAERGFHLQNLESVLKNLESESAEDAMTTSKTGSAVTETSVEKLKRVAKADIIMQLTWTVDRSGINKAITFNLQGLDAYSNKQIATAQGTGKPSASATLIVMLEEAVLAHLDNFNASLQAHFDDLFANGREVVIKVKKWDSWDGDLEKEYNGKELNEILGEWMSRNTVKGRFSTPVSSTNKMVFNQVRIPMYDENGVAIDAKMFAQKIRKFLKEAPYSITTKVTTNGLGEATLILGEK